MSERVRAEQIERLPGWMLAAECQYVPELPWTDEPAAVSRYARTTMARVCLACPVLAQCEAYAGGPSVVAGFWAGRFRAIGPRWESALADRPSWWPTQTSGGAA